MKNLISYITFSVVSVLIVAAIIPAVNSYARTTNIKEVRFKDPELLREIVRNINSDSISNEIKRYFFPYANLRNKKYIYIGLQNYPFSDECCYEPDIIEELIPEGVSLDSCTMLITITYSNNLPTTTFTKYRGDTLWIESFSINEKYNDMYLEFKANAKINYSVDLKYLMDFIITQFLYIDGKLYLNPNKADWIMAYQ